jgi:VWFA-related protein
MRLPCVVTCAAAIAAVSWQDQSPRFATRTELVRIDVLASRDGTPIVGLERDDFIVTDNGVLQDVDRVTGVQSPVEAWLILDQSGSVRGRSAELNVAVRTFLGQLGAADRAHVVTFRHGLRLLPDVGASSEAVHGALAETSEGYSSLRDAIALALTLRDIRFDRSMLLVLSDGADTMSWLAEPQLDERISRADPAIYALVSQSDQGSNGAKYLARVAESTGGRVIRVSEPSKLAQAFVAALAEAKARYVLTYYPRGVTRTGWHEIRVRLRHGPAEIRARRGYMVDRAN